MAEADRLYNQTMSNSRPSRRYLLKAGAAIVAASFAAGCGASASPTTSTSSGLTPGPLIGPTILPTAVASPVKGQLLIVQDGNFQSFDLGSMSSQPITKFPKVSYAASPRLSFDRASVAYTFYIVPKDPKDLGGSDLYVMDAAGTNPRLVRAHPEGGATFEDPTFTSDAKSILATLRTPIYDQGQFKGETLSIQRVNIDGGATTLLVDNAVGPAASPDGKYLIYTGVDDKGALTGLRVADSQGKGGKDLISSQGFAYARFPVFSPDGSLVVFAAVSSSGMNLPPPKVRVPTFGAGIAEAHGIPWEIWTIRPDGSELKQLTHESEDTPVPVWSPKGDWIAFAGEIGLYLVDAEGKLTTRISTTVSSGGIAWLA